MKNTINKTKILSIFLCAMICNHAYAKDYDQEGSFTKPSSPIKGNRIDNSNESGLDLDALTRGIEAAEREVQQQIKTRPYATRVLVVGLTGSAKSTLVHALAGKMLLVQESVHGDSWEVNPAPGHLIPGYEVGHGLRSVTTTPCSWYDERSNLVYWDCPGFLDSRGPMQEIINAFAINQLLRAPSRVKILLAMQEADFQNARGSGALDRIEKLIGLIPELEQLKQTLSFVVTRKGDAFPSQKKIKRLLNDVAAECDEKRSQGEDVEILEKATNLLSYLANTSNTVFSFPAPTNEGNYPDTLFVDKLALIGSLQANPVNNPSHSFAFETDVVMGICHMMQKFGNVGEVIYDLVKDMHVAYRDKNLEILQTWQIFVTHLISNISSFVSPLQLANEITRNLPTTTRTDPRFLSIVERLESNQRYIDFVKIIDCITFTELNIPAILEKSLFDIQSELQTLVEHKQFLIEQKERTEALAQEVVEERKAGKINKEQADRKIAELEQQSERDKERAEKRIDEICQEQERAQQKADADLKKALADIQSQHEAQLSALKKQMDDMAKAAAESERMRAVQERMSSMTLSPSFGGGFSMMDLMHGYSSFNEDYGASSRSYGGSRYSAPQSAPRMVHVSGYTKANGTKVSGYTRRASRK